VLTIDAKGWPLAQTPIHAALQIRPVPQATGASTDHVCLFSSVPTSSLARAAVNALLAHHAKAVTAVKPSSQPTLITAAWELTRRNVRMDNYVFLGNVFRSTLPRALLPVVALMEGANQDLTAQTTSVNLSRSQPTCRSAEAAQSLAEATGCASRVSVSAA
jgi:hypothetical protein